MAVLFLRTLYKKMFLLQCSNGIATFTWRCRYVHREWMSWRRMLKVREEKELPSWWGSQESDSDLWLPVWRPFWYLCSSYWQTRPSVYLNWLPVALTKFVQPVKFEWGESSLLCYTRNRNNCGGRNRFSQVGIQRTFKIKSHLNSGRLHCSQNFSLVKR